MRGVSCFEILYNHHVLFNINNDGLEVHAEEVIYWLTILLPKFLGVKHLEVTTVTNHWQVVIIYTPAIRKVLNPHHHLNQSIVRALCNLQFRWEVKYNLHHSLTFVGTLMVIHLFGHKSVLCPSVMDTILTCGQMERISKSNCCHLNVTGYHYFKCIIKTILITLT